MIHSGIGSRGCGGSLFLCRGIVQSCKQQLLIAVWPMRRPDLHLLTFLVTLNGNCMFINTWWFVPRKKTSALDFRSGTVSNQLKWWVWWCLAYDPSSQRWGRGIRSSRAPGTRVYTDMHQAGRTETHRSMLGRVNHGGCRGSSLARARAALLEDPSLAPGTHSVAHNPCSRFSRS